MLAGLGEVLALQGGEHVAEADDLAGEEGGDQVAQRGDLARLEVLELAAGAAAGRVEVAHLEFHFQGEGDAVDLEQQAALVQVADLHRRGAGGEGEAAGGDVQQARVDPLAVGADVADARGQLDPCVLALGFGFMHDVDVDGGIHGLRFLSSGSAARAAVALSCSGRIHTIVSSTATNTLAAEKVMARDDQVLNQRWKLARPRSSLVFWRVHDCWSRRKNT
ncbi:hypothetical protein D3C76_1073210 [compost metagenome]